MGYFQVDDASECDKAKEGADGATNAELLVHGAVTCCKSKALDQSVCKVDKCIFGMSKCMILHNDFSAVEDKLTDPKALEVDENDESYGSCPKAILNKVEGALCCTAGMKQMSTCVPSEVGDMASCKDTWKKAFEADFYDKAEAIVNAFKSGGYCTASTTAQPPPACDKCGTIETDKPSCCGQGGAWFGKCGDADAEHTWYEGIQACTAETTVTLATTTTATPTPKVTTVPKATTVTTVTTTPASTSTTSSPPGNSLGTTCLDRSEYC